MHTHRVFACTLLPLACFVQGHLHVVWALLHAGFPTTDIDEVGNNALMLACTAGSAPVVAAIASGGCT